MRNDGELDRLVDEETSLTDLHMSTGPSPPPTRVLVDLQAQEDRSACLRWLALRQLRQGPRHPCLFDRGAEDCQEGHEGG